MEKENLKQLLLRAINDCNAPEVYIIILKFDPVLKKFARQLGYDCAMTDLIIFMIEFLRKCKAAKIETYSEAQLVNYVLCALRNKKIDLHRKRCEAFEEIHTDEIFAIEDSSNNSLETELLQCIQQLSLQQQKVIMRKFIYGFSDVEIAKQMKISRQAVNKLKSRALESLKEKLEE